MKLLVLYRPESERSTELETYLQEFSKRHPDTEISLIDYDSVEGTRAAELYGIMQQPALIIIGPEEKLIASWAGPTLPLMDEVTGYLNS